MKSKKSKKNIAKKKKKIILTCISVILLILVVVGLSVLSILTPHELNSTGLNTIYTNENKENEVENRFMVLDPSENEEQPEDPKENDNHENNTAQEKPKVVDSPYYIKVNNMANVVTVYKKDKNRRLYSTCKSNDLLYWNCNTFIRNIYNFRPIYMEIIRTEMSMDSMLQELQGQYFSIQFHIKRKINPHLNGGNMIN